MSLNIFIIKILNDIPLRTKIRPAIFMSMLRIILLYNLIKTKQDYII